MGKIKNWDNLDWKTAKKSSKLWVNRHPTATSKFGKPVNRAKIEINKDPNSSGYVAILTRYVYKGEEMVDKQSMVKEFSTKDDARKWAVDWMRSHPAG